MNGRAGPPLRARLASAACRAALLLAFAPLALAQDDGYVPLEKRLSAEQLQATGLDGLSAEQLALLNRLLREERSREAASEAGLRPRRAPPAQPVRAALVGETRGWAPGQVLALDDGQRWRVVEGSLHLRRPLTGAKVSVQPGAFGAWYLQIDGETPKAKVQRIE